MKWKKSICVSLMLSLLLTGVNDISIKGQAKGKLKLNKSSIELKVKEKITLKFNNKKLNKKAKWSSKNTDVAIVSSKGKVTGVDIGKTIIYGKINGKKYGCKVKVKGKSLTPGTTGKQQIVFDKTSVVLAVGDKETINISMPSGVPGKGIKWSSSDDSIASVSNGIITANKIGNVTISCTCGDTVTNCIVEVIGAYGSVSGNITYLYNKYKGNVADTGAEVFLIPKDKSAYTMADFQTYAGWHNISDVYSKEYNIFSTKVDGTGNYLLQNIPIGEYFIYVISERVIDGIAFNGGGNNVKIIFSGYLSETNAQFLGEYTGYHKYSYETIVIKKNETTSYSHDFGITYI